MTPEQQAAVRRIVEEIERICDARNATRLRYAKEEAANPYDAHAHKAAAHEIRMLKDDLLAVLCAQQQEPIPMVLHCPKCGAQHIDRPEPAKGWTNPPHRSHLCHACGTIWRPADVPTTGVVQAATQGSADTWSAAAVLSAPPADDDAVWFRNLRVGVRELVEQQASRSLRAHLLAAVDEAVRRLSAPPADPTYIAEHAEPWPR